MSERLITKERVSCMNSIYITIEGPWVFSESINTFCRHSTGFLFIFVGSTESTLDRMVLLSPHQQSFIFL